MNNQKISFKYILLVFGAVLFTWLFHEFGHWISYKLMGFEPYLSFNKVGIRGNDLPNTTQQLLGTAAGPIITLLQAIVAYYILIKKGWNKYLYPFLFIPFYMRLLAGIMNVMSPNDEGVISQHFGLGLFTISIMMSLVLFWLVYKVSKKYQLTPKFHLFNTLLVMLFSSLVILSDQFFRLELI
jgi:hypothetical protein